MSKESAVKYLEILQQKGLIECEETGPSKLWCFSAESAEKKRIKILVVDDDTNVITIIKDFLSPDQFEILPAMNGKEALEAARSECPDLILLDLMMSGMDGHMVCEELHKHDQTRDIPIIILTARTSVEDKLKAMKLGIKDYIIKPFDLRELETRIKTALNSA